MKVPIQVVSDEEAEQADYVVCMRKGAPTPFADNVTGTCSMCAHEVIYRPHAPKRPLRVCVECAIELAEETDP